VKQKKKELLARLSFAYSQSFFFGLFQDFENNVVPLHVRLFSNPRLW
jgi:hypothetical protein